MGAKYRRERARVSAHFDDQRDLYILVNQKDEGTSLFDPSQYFSSKILQMKQSISYLYCWCRIIVGSLDCAYKYI